MNWEIKSWGKNGNITYYHVQIEVTFDLTNWRSTSIPESKYGGKVRSCRALSMLSPLLRPTQPRIFLSPPFWVFMKASLQMHD